MSWIRRKLWLLAVAVLPTATSGCTHGWTPPIPVQPWVTERMEEKYAHKNDGRVPIIVTHGGTVRMLIAAWLRLSDDALDFVHFASHPTGIAVLLSWGEAGQERMIERVSDIAHLSGVDGWVSLRDVIR